MIRWLLLMSRQGKVRLAKWYTTTSQKDRAKTIKEITPLVLSRAPKLCNFLDWRDCRVVYKRYASLYFVVAIDQGDNELLTLEIIHEFVEILDRYFGNVCELDLIFNFHKARKRSGNREGEDSDDEADEEGGRVHQSSDIARWAYFILDELILAGELLEPSKNNVLTRIEQQDQLVMLAEAGVEEPIVHNGPRG